MSNILIIGLGSDLRGDDSVGLVIARKLRHRVPPHIRIIEHNGDGFSLLSEWQDEDRVIIIDAAQSGVAPGTIHEFDAITVPLNAQLSPATSHAFGLVEAIRLGRQLDRLPEALVLIGIEGESFEMGSDLSAEVENAVDDVIERVLKKMCVN